MGISWPLRKPDRNTNLSKKSHLEIRFLKELRDVVSEQDRHRL